MQVNQGSIHYRLGVVMGHYEEAVREGNLEKAANVLGVAKTWCSVYMNKEERSKLRKMPGFAYGDHRQPHQVFEDMGLQWEYILECIKDHGVFAKPELEMGDSSALDEEAPVAA